LRRGVHPEGIHPEGERGGEVLSVIRHQNHYNFNGDSDISSVYRRTNMNSVSVNIPEPLLVSVVEPLVLSIVEGFMVCLSEPLNLLNMKKL